MSKFDNLKGVFDELERLYDAAPEIDWSVEVKKSPDKSYYLEKILQLWESRANMDIVVGFLATQSLSADSRTKEVLERLDKIAKHLEDKI